MAHELGMEVVKSVQITLYLLTIILGSAGNSVVIWMVGVRMKPTASNVWLVNLAVADLVFCISRVLTAISLGLRHWSFGVPLCQVNGLLKYTNMFCSVFLLVVISVDRALCIWRPLRAKIMRTVSLSRAVSAGVWVVALALSLPYAINRTTGLDSYNNTKCTMETMVSAGGRTGLYLVRFLFGFLLPFLVIACCYVLAGWGIRQSRLNRKMKILHILVLLVSAFFLCWVPYHALLLVKMVNSKSQWVKLGLPVATGLSYFNSCVNPILYFCVGLDRQKNFKRSISGALRRALEDDGIGPVTEGQEAEGQGVILQQSTKPQDV
ncbi:C3a anaphylatoxin chemotactic receptor-like [Alosa pseudoharengus]|uniref:C3a anaphylatoxin chemotactic receptor-like n=1 Tax=Alosa pseudoharengus TaxID=34774 RepID=UPI003F89BC50